MAGPEQFTEADLQALRDSIPRPEQAEAIRRLEHQRLRTMPVDHRGNLKLFEQMRRYAQSIGVLGRPASREDVQAKRHYARAINCRSTPGSPERSP